MPRFASHSGRSCLIRSRIRFSNFCGEWRLLLSTGASHSEQLILGMRRLLGQLHVQITNEERPAVRLLLDDLRGRLAVAVTRLRVDANEHGLRAALRRLECSRVAEGEPGHDAI